MIGQTIPLLYRALLNGSLIPRPFLSLGTRLCSTAVYGTSLKQTTFGWVKDTISAGASSMFIQLTGEEFYSWYASASKIMFV